MLQKVVAPPEDTKGQALYVVVNTYGQDDSQLGSRVVDMYHYGTRNWLINHTWWAMHNGHRVVQALANDEQVVEFITQRVAS